MLWPVESLFCADGLSLCRLFWNQIWTERGVIPNRCESVCRWSKFGSGSRSKLSISTESWSLVILQRLPLVDDVPSEDSDAAGSCSEVDELYELDGDAGALSGGGSSSTGDAGRDLTQAPDAGAGIFAKGDEVLRNRPKLRTISAGFCRS
jgi:hypothetical protein